MATRVKAKSSSTTKAKAPAKSKKKGAMKGMTVKGGHKLSVKQGAGLTQKGRDSINRRTGSNLKAPAPNGKPGTKAGARKSLSVLALEDGLANGARLHVDVGSADYAYGRTST